MLWQLSHLKKLDHRPHIHSFLSVPDGMSVMDVLDILYAQHTLFVSGQLLVFDKICLFMLYVVMYC